MNHYKKSAELKNIAKDKLLGKYGAAILVVFLTELINLASSYLTALLTPTGGIGALIITLIVSLAVSALVGILNAGTCYFFLNIACNQPFTVNDLFCGFREQPNKCLAISSVFALLQFICMTPYQLISNYALSNPNNTKLLLLTAGCWLAGMLLYVPFSLAISQSFYLIWDFPGLTAKETLQKSCQIMKGHKGRLFYMEMSFLPLMIVCLFTCCIGFLWLLPYMYMTLTCFFLDLMNPQKG